MNTVLRHAGSMVVLLLLIWCQSTLASQNTLLVMGDSLSAAYGVQNEDAWVEQLRQRLEAQGYGHWEVVNASISGETTDGGVRRLPALLERHTPNIVIIELGGNDGLRGFQPGLIEQNLETMIEQAHKSGARALLVGMQIPPNYGPRYTSLFAAIYPRLADSLDTALVPFFLEGIYNREGMMQADGIHPSAAAQTQLLDNIWPVLAPMLGGS